MPCDQVNPTELSRIFGVSRKWIYDLVEKGMPRNGRHFDVATCVQWYMAEVKGVGPTEERSDVTEARRLLYLAQTEKTSLENQRLSGLLVDLDEARSVLYGVASIVATQHDGLAARLSGLIVGETDIKVIQTTLFDELRSIRQAIADAVVELSPSGSGDDRPAPKANRSPVGRRKKNPAPRKPRAGEVADQPDPVLHSDP